MLALDAMDKAADVKLLQAELNDKLGFCIKVLGDCAALRVALDAGQTAVEKVRGDCTTAILPAPDKRAWRAIESPAEYSPLLEAQIVFFPNFESTKPTETAKEHPVSDSKSYAIGLIETQGFTALIEAVDSACKAADVQVVGKEKLGGGYVTVIIKGDVAAVKAAIEAGQTKVTGLGNLIAAHVIARPSDAVISLIPKAES